MGTLLKSFLYTACLVGISTLLGCASTHPGKMGNRTQGDYGELVASAYKIDKYSDPTHTMIDFTFENKGDDWVKVKGAHIKCKAGCNGREKILVGEDLKNFLEALEARLKKEEHNKKVAETVLTVVGLGGAAVGSMTNNAALLIGGIAIASAGMIGGMAREIGNSIRKAETSGQVPESHIYRDPVSIPTSNILRRWAVIEHAKSAAPQILEVTLSPQEGTSPPLGLEFVMD